MHRGIDDGLLERHVDAADAVDELDEAVEVHEGDVVDLRPEAVGERAAQLLEGGLALAGRLLQVEVEAC